ISILGHSPRGGFSSKGVTLSNSAWLCRVMGHWRYLRLSCRLTAPAGSTRPARLIGLSAGLMLPLARVDHLAVGPVFPRGAGLISWDRFFLEDPGVYSTR